MGGKEFIKALNEAKVIQDFWWEEEEFPEELQKAWDSLQPELLVDGLNVSKHRWYETSESYFKTNDGTIVGIRFVTDIFSESTSISDCYWTLVAFEGEKVQITSYQPKEK